MASGSLPRASRATVANPRRHAWAAPLGQPGLLCLLAGLGYVGRPWLAAVPVSTAWLCLASVRSPARALRRLGPILAMLALLLASALVSALVHPSTETASVLATLVACCALAVLLGLGRQDELTWFFLAAATVVTAVLVVLTALGAPAQFASKTPLGALGLARWLGGGVSLGRGVLNANAVGVVASVTAAGWVAGAIAPGSCRRRLLSLAGALVVVAVLVSTGSRGGLTALGGGALAALAGRRHVVLIGAAAAGCLVSLLAVALLTPAPPVPGVQGPGRSAQDSPASIGHGLTDLAWRAAVWKGTAAAIDGSPWVGRGIGSFPQSYVPSPSAEQPVNSHDTFLQVWLDLGLGGLLALLGLTAYAILYPGTRASISASALAVSAAGVAWLLHSVVESTVVVTIASSQPWLGSSEVVVPLGFALWGLAAAQPEPAEVSGS